MNTHPTYQLIRRTLLTVLLAGLGTLPAHAQYTFNSGSNGSYGPMNITANTTLDMPADGIFHCTTITVASGMTLTFTPNPLNTPVYLLATGDVTVSGVIDVSGGVATIMLSGAGGPGGFAGGMRSLDSLAPGDGHGPGAGKASGGQGAYGTAGWADGRPNGAIYGSPLLLPLLGGSGGGGGYYPGNGGGGAIMIASSTRIDLTGTTGYIKSVGGISFREAGIGSSGAVRLVAPIVAGSGAINVGGTQYSGYMFNGGSGRIRIDCMDRRSLGLTYTGPVSIGANMVTFPPNLPHLDITKVAGRVIDVGTSSAVSFTLPQDSSPNQQVTVQATHFGAVVPIRVVLTPDNGSSTSYDAQIDNIAAGSASVTVDVVVPVNVNVSVKAWTR